MAWIVASLVLLCGLEVEDLSAKGAAAMRAGKYREAEAVFRQLVKQFPHEAGWQGNLGLALYSQGKYQESVVALEKSLKLHPAPGLANVLGVAYLKMGRPCDAVAPLRKAGKPDVLADALSDCKQYGEAARVYEQMGNSRAAGKAYWQARDYSAAKRIFSGIEGSFSTDPEFNYEFGDTLLRLEGAQASIRYLERAISLVPARGALGKALIELDRYAEAIPHLEAATAVDSTLLLPLSRAYQKTGRATNAATALKRYKEKLANQN